MKPRALDSRKSTTCLLLLGAALSALGAQAWAVSLHGIQTDVRDRDGYTRCVVQLSGKTEFFQRNFLERRQYFLVDIYNVSPRVAERFITPAAGPVRQIHVLNRKGPESNVLTLVFYLTDIRRYHVRSVEDPFRIVIDVIHSSEGLKPSQPSVAPGPVAPTPPALAG